MDAVRQAYFSVGPLLATFLLGVITIILLVWNSMRKQRYWKEMGIPFAKPLPFFGFMFQTMRKPLQFVDMERFKKYGRIYGHFEGNNAILSVAEPDILRNIFVKDFHAFPGRRNFPGAGTIFGNSMFVLRGEDWKRVRSIVSPTFTTGKLKKMIGIFNECSQTLVKNLRQTSEKGESVDVTCIYSAFTMDSIASTAFSTKIDSHNDPNNEFVSIAKHFFPRKMTWRLFALCLCIFLHPSILKLLNVSFFPPKVTKFFSSTVLQIIEERKRTGQTRNDFLQLLLDTAKENANDGKTDMNEKDDIVENYGKLDSSQIFKGYYSKKNLSHDELVAQCVMFFIGGFDTTASTLAFVSYSLALHPDIQEKLILEVDEAIKNNNGELTYEAIQSLKYLDNVIAETMRLYPPIIRLERLADVDYELGDTGLTIPKGMIVTIPIYAMHRDPKLFPDPEKFNPDRFLPEEREKQVPYSYLPFGAGPKNCVAMRFALMEVKVCLAHVLRNFRIKTCPTTKVPLEYDLGLGFLRPKSISLYMEIRNDFAL